MQYIIFHSIVQFSVEYSEVKQPEDKSAVQHDKDLWLNSLGDIQVGWDIIGEEGILTVGYGTYYGWYEKLLRRDNN